MLDALTRPQVLPFLNLSGSASLRETSAIQSREELFTPRRQGANEEAFQSKSTIPFLNLSGFASLREPENCVERGLCRNAGERSGRAFQISVDLWRSKAFQILPALLLPLMSAFETRSLPTLTRSYPRR